LSSRFIPRDQLSSVLPWTLASLDPQHIKRKNGLVEEIAGQELSGSAVDQARDEGFRHGLEVGFGQGCAAIEVKKLHHNKQFDQILAGLQSAVAALDESVANDLMELALELARQVVRTHIVSKPDAILPVLREALNNVVAIAQHPRLVMHPEDAEIVKREMSDELAAYNCRISHDELMLRGGVRIDDDTFEVDATMPTRWARTIAKLGLKSDWLA